MASSKIKSELGFRLPNQLKPIKYALKMEPNTETKTFKGEVNIKFELLKPLSYIPVHSKRLNVQTKQMQLLNSTHEPVETISPSLCFECPEFDYWITEFDSPLQEGIYCLHLDFNGSLDNNFMGFYQSTYMDHQSKEKRWNIMIFL